MSATGRTLVAVKTGRAALAVAGVTIAPTLGFLSTTASAEDPLADHQPCVSMREYHGTNLGISVVNAHGISGNALDVRELEERWEVRGLRVATYPYGERREVIQYPACGFSPEEVAVYAVVVTRGGKALSKALVEQTIRVRRAPAVTGQP